jgi:S-disulfanyl-L-cysteine oxidoreductase SoxD
MQKTGVMFVVGGVVLTLALSVTAGAQGDRSANDGVYTEEQAARGEAIYVEQCAFCHGDNLEGMGPMPALAGGDFLMNWQSRTLADLFQKNHETMPATAPGTLTPEEAADVTAFLLKASEFPAGSVALEARLEPLRLIKVGTPRR